MRAKPLIYPVFLPHAGCPFRCVYCNQEAVSSSAPVPSDPAEFAIEAMQRYAQLVRTTGRSGEVAFYGGTFTALPPEKIRAILDCAAGLAREGVFSGIRFSTRPDAVTPGVCRLLSHYPVRTVELGVQSLSDTVLAAGRRGYSADAVSSAARLVSEHGWALGVQLMPGLPSDTRELFLGSVRKTLALKPDFVRIYPTVVLKGTALARWFAEGRYVPLSLEEAIDWCVCAVELLDAAGVPAARMGLHADPELLKPGTIVAGPFHPAFGYLVRARRWLNRVDRMLADQQASIAGKTLTVRIASRFLSEAVGQGRGNIRYWQSKWRLREVVVEGDLGIDPTGIDLSLK